MRKPEVRVRVFEDIFSFHCHIYLIPEIPGAQTKALVATTKLPKDVKNDELSYHSAISAQEIDMGIGQDQFALLKTEVNKRTNEVTSESNGLKWRPDIHIQLKARVVIDYLYKKRLINMEGKTAWLQSMAIPFKDSMRQSRQVLLLKGVI